MNRSQLPDGYFHVTAHAVNGEDVFTGEGERRFYASLLDVVARKYRWRILSFALMGNHVHLLLYAETKALSAGMYELQWRHACHCNLHRGRVGHLFRRRFHSLPVLTERHLVGSIRYIAINPVKDGFVEHAEDWKWSAHRTLAGIGVPAPFVAVDEALSFVGGRECYLALVAEAERDEDRWIAQRKAPPPIDSATLAGMIDAHGDAALLELRRTTSVSLGDLAALLGCSRTTVHRRLSAAAGA